MKKICYILIPTMLLISCGKKDKPVKEVSIEPTEEIIGHYKNKDFSIVLDDMKIDDETYFRVYKQKYNILTIENDSLHVKNTPWQTVSEKYFTKHENDLGMEIVSNHNNTLTRVAKPIGFGWAVGNKNHGEWETTPKDSITPTRTSTTRWRTRPSSFFYWYWLTSRRTTYQNDYRGYQAHANRGTAYYGNSTNNGTHTYGTRSVYQKKARNSFFTRKKAHSSTWNSFKNKVSRSSSRYDTGSTTRARSGGFGK